MTHVDADPHAGGTAKRKLPIGIRTFRTIREEGCCYANKYRRLGRPIHRVGVGLSRDARNVAAFEVEAS